MEPDFLLSMLPEGLKSADWPSKRTGNQEVGKTKKKKRFKNVCDEQTSLLVANRSRRESRREGSGYKRGGLVFFQGAHRYNP